MYFQFGVIERAIVEIICVWSILLFITCYVNKIRPRIEKRNTVSAEETLKR